MQFITIEKQPNQLEYFDSEARSRGGARVYFRNTDDGVEILGYSNKSNQQTVIDRILSIFK